MLESMLPHEPVDDRVVDTQLINQRAEEALQLARQQIQGLQPLDASRYNHADGTFIFNQEGGCGCGPRRDAAALARSS